MSYSASSGSAKKVKSEQNGKKKSSSPLPNDLSSDDNDDEPVRAPLQLKAEFVNAIMFRQWVIAKKLCHFILMYEPNNVEAKQYGPLIDYMLNKEQSESSSDDSSDDDSSRSSSSSSSSNEDEKRPPSAQAQKPVNASQSSKFTNHH